VKKKNTIITALIALFIVFAGVKSVSADHVINKSETERISKLINGMTQWLKASYDEDFKKQKVARNSGVFYWGTNGELAWYHPETGKVTDPYESKTISQTAQNPFEGGDRSAESTVLLTV